MSVKPEHTYRARKQDNEEVSELCQKVLDNALKGHDKYGNPLVKIGMFWCGCEFDRLRQIAKEAMANGDLYVALVQVADGRIVSFEAQYAAKSAFKFRITSGRYRFLDSAVQEVFP